MLDDVTQDAFRRNLNATFRMEVEGSGAVDLVLSEVNDLSSAADRDQFSILFRGPLRPVFQQSIYRLEHSELGTIDLFLVPIGQDKEGTTYEAIINRLLKASPK